MKLKNPPPRNARLTKKLALEVLSVLKEIDYKIFMPRVLDRPSNSMDLKWVRDIEDRVIAIEAHLNTWKDNEKKSRGWSKPKARPRRNCDRFETADEALLYYKTKLPENNPYKGSVFKYIEWLFATTKESEVTE